MLIWPAAGIGLAAFVLNPRRLWPVFIIACYIAGIISDVFVAHRLFMSSVGFMTGNMVESIGCASLILYVTNDFREFTKVSEVMALIVGTIIINAFSACIGAGTSVLTQGTSFTASWLSWYVADGLGILLVGPFIISWVINIKDLITSITPKKISEAIAFILIWLILSFTIFNHSNNTSFWFSHQYILAALLAWPAMRFGMKGVTLALMIFFTISLFSTVINNGDYYLGVINSDQEKHLMEHQLFLMFLSFIGYLMATFYLGLKQNIAESKKAGDTLKESEYLLRETQAIAGLGSYILDVKTGIWQSSDILNNIFGIDEKYICSVEGWTNIIHPEWQALMTDYFANYVLGQHGIFDKEYKIVRINDKAERWVHGLGKLEFDSDDQPVKMIGSISDITWRKNIEEELKNRLNELQRFRDITVGRELTMIVLKKEVNELLVKSGRNEKYKIIS